MRLASYASARAFALRKCDGAATLNLDSHGFSVLIVGHVALGGMSARAVSEFDRKLAPETRDYRAGLTNCIAFDTAGFHSKAPSWRAAPASARSNRKQCIQFGRADEIVI